jgi:hypothetical protein
MFLSSLHHDDHDDDVDVAMEIAKKYSTMCRTTLISSSFDSLDHQGEVANMNALIGEVLDNIAAVGVLVLGRGLMVEGSIDCTSGSKVVGLHTEVVAIVVEEDSLPAEEELRNWNRDSRIACTFVFVFVVVVP